MKIVILIYKKIEKEKEISKKEEFSGIGTFNFKNQLLIIYKIMVNIRENKRRI